MIDRRVPVTRKQVRAAELEVAALRSAGIEPDPMVERLASVGTSRTTSWNISEAPRDLPQRGVSEGTKEVTELDEAFRSRVREPSLPHAAERQTTGSRPELDYLERAAAATAAAVDRAVKAVDEALEREASEGAAAIERGDEPPKRHERELGDDDFGIGI